MVGTDDSAKSPKNLGNPSSKFVEKNENLISPGFRSIAAMAGWDEEALLMASVIVEDTPDRQLKQKKRSVFNRLKTPPTNSSSRRKKRSERRSPASIPVAILDLDEDEPKSKLESEKVSNEEVEEEKERGDKENGACSAIPCLDRLREELSCAICLEICYEPSSTPCGHSFCKNCLRSAADRCGKKCPKCRHLISNGRYCTVNTVLWNTIQLLFPKEVEARKAADSASDTSSHNNTRNRVVEALNSSPVSGDGGRNHQRLRNRRRSLRRPQSSSGELPGQDRDAALALRLQREEFMERSSLATARANLRAMASRAINIRVRGRRD